MNWFLNAGLRFLGSLVVLGSIFCTDVRSALHAESSLPASSDVVQRMLARAQTVARGELGPRHTYNKLTVLEEQDSRGRCLKSEVKQYKVTLIAGYPFNRLVKIQGRELNPEELKKEEQREERFRQRFISSDAKQMSRRREAWITTNLMDRFNVTIQDRTVLSNRSTLVLRFQPKEGKQQAKTIQDQILNKIAATVWMDEDDAEPVRVEATLQEPVSFGWFGVLGSLSRCRLSLERLRLNDGVWVNRRQQLSIQYRKLTATRHFQQREDSSNFE